MGFKFQSRSIGRISFIVRLSNPKLEARIRRWCLAPERWLMVQRGELLSTTFGTALLSFGSFDPATTRKISPNRAKPGFFSYKTMERTRKDQRLCYVRGSEHRYNRFMLLKLFLYSQVIITKAKNVAVEVAVPPFTFGHHIRCLTLESTSHVPLIE